MTGVIETVISRLTTIETVTQQAWRLLSAQEVSHHTSYCHSDLDQLGFALADCIKGVVATLPLQALIDLQDHHQ